MTSFLSIVAADAVEFYQENLSEVRFILPNRRSCTRFLKELSLAISQPVWAPAVLSVSDWVEEASPLSRCSDRESLFYLYRALQANWSKTDSFENFLSWGETLLRDFDELDKYLADPAVLFRQLTDEKEIAERFSLLGEPEYGVILRFWSGVRQDPSGFQQDWLDLWNRMYTIYAGFHNLLQADGKSTLGAMYRSLVTETGDRLASGQAVSPVCFIGFNAPVKAEEELFRLFSGSKKARFYWDVPEFLRIYPELFPAPESFLQRYGRESGRFKPNHADGYEPIHTYSFETGVAQARMMAQLASAEERTAIILGDESLLDELGWALTLESSQYNISIGREFVRTRAGQQIGTVLSSINLSDNQVIDVIKVLRKELKELSSGSYPEDPFNEAATGILEETILEMEHLNRCFPDLMSTRVAVKTARELVKAGRVAFESNYDAPVQITGILESRLMDFDRVIILSFNEGVWPSSAVTASFIPYHLRKEFGMPVQSALDKMYGYHFFRLLQRAKKVHIGYLAMTEARSGRAGELSRFLRQAEIMYHQQVIHQPQSMKVEAQAGALMEVPKDEQVMRFLGRYTGASGFTGRLSPSALNTYLDCSLKFYYQYILGLKDPAEHTDLSDPRLFGTLVHESMERLYGDPGLQGRISAELVRQLLSDTGRLKDTVNQVLGESKAFAQLANQSGEPDAKRRLITDTVVTYLTIILQTDLQYVPFEIVALEKESEARLIVPQEGQQIEVRVGGIIDRTDRKDGLIRILDYKTGKASQTTKDYPDLLDRKKKDRPKEIFQTLVYCYLERKSGTYDDLEIIPGLYVLRNHQKGVLDPGIQVNQMLLDREELYMEETGQQLTQLLTELFDPEQSFTATENTQTCRYCRFSQVCGRER